MSAGMVTAQPVEGHLILADVLTVVIGMGEKSRLEASLCDIHDEVAAARALGRAEVCRELALTLGRRIGIDVSGLT